MKRSLYVGNDLSRIQSVSEMRECAKRRLPDFAWQYIESGSEDEHTLKRNRAVFRNYMFAPHTLVDTSLVDTSVNLFGSSHPFPIVVAPTGFNGLASPDGDVSLARAAASMKIPFTLSSFSNQTLEEVAKQADGTQWFQLYVLDNEAVTDELIRRAREAGYRALVITTDANISSAREWQRRCYRAPGKLTFRHQLESVRHLAWLTSFCLSAVKDGAPIFANLQSFFDRSQLGATRSGPLITGQLKPKITWTDIERIRRLWDGPLIVKGVLTVKDAFAAKQCGADGIVITNHGGRQLDDAIAPLDILPEIRDALPHLPILIDSGFRRGNDILKAIGLGADAVMLGRATLYGLAAAGQPGVIRVLEILTSEICRTLQLLGCTSLSEVRDHMHRVTVPEVETIGRMRADPDTQTRSFVVSSAAISVAKEKVV